MSKAIDDLLILEARSRRELNRLISSRDSIEFKCKMELEKLNLIKRKLYAEGFSGNIMRDKNGDRVDSLESIDMAAERRKEFVKLRSQGLTWAKVGEAMGVTAGRAAQVVKNELRSPKPYEGLSVRTESCIRNAFGFSIPLTDEDIVFASENMDKLNRQPNCGAKSRREVLIMAARIKGCEL